MGKVYNNNMKYKLLYGTIINDDEKASDPFQELNVPDKGRFIGIEYKHNDCFEICQNWNRCFPFNLTSPPEVVKQIWKDKYPSNPAECYCFITDLCTDMLIYRFKPY
jgi:hypothetical protein